MPQIKEQDKIISKLRIGEEHLFWRMLKIME